ncbi:hypothetical protein Tco_0735131 [Tanacetum coccineum]
MAFVSSSNNNTSSSNEAVNAAHEVSTTSTQVNTDYSKNIDNLSDVVICSFFASQPNSPQLAHEDLIQEGSFLLMAMRPLVLISPKWSATTVTKGDILLGSKELQEIKTTRTRKAQEESDQAEEGPNYALMAFSSLNYDSEIVDNCKKGLGYNEVPPPYIGNFIPPKPDLFFTGLDEFGNKLVVEKCKAISSKEEPKEVRNNDDANY